MRIFSSLGCWSVAGLLACGGAVLPARAADPAQAPIKGESVMGDKGRSGPDGWSWAPQTRDQSPTGNGPGGEASAPNRMANPGQPAGTHLSAGQDPGTPSSNSAGGPTPLTGNK